MSFIYLILFTPNEHTEIYRYIGQNDKNFLFEIDDRKNVYVGEKLFSSETTHKIGEYSSNDGLSVVK